MNLLHPDRMPGRIVGTFGAGIFRMDNRNVEVTLLERAHIGVAQSPNKNRVGSFVHVGMPMAFPEFAPIAKRSARDPWPIDHRIDVFPGLLRPRIEKK